MEGFNFDLAELAKQRIHIKQGFIPSGDPSGGGAPPDASGAPPMDPGAGGPPPDAGGAPPPDPSMGAAPPPQPPPDSGVGGGPPGGDIAAQVSQGVSQALAMSGMQGSGKPTAPKPDINTVATDIFQLKKMFLHFLRVQGIELPPDILDGPNRDPQTGAPAVGPTGGSDAQPGSSMQGQSAIKPIGPMQGAFPSSPAPGGGGMGGMGKTSSAKKIGEEVTGQRVLSKAAAVASMLRRKQKVA